MTRILEALGNPERRFRSVHVAGTNGKGSTAAMIEAVLREAGFRTGLYTSPHLVDLTERFRIDGLCISPPALEEAIDTVLTVETATPLDEPLTFFEVTTLAAFCLFARARVEWAVVETGLGGRLDATNVLAPALSVITSLGLDHTEYLGPTLESIAAEKGGIIKPGIPVVCGADDPVACGVIRRLAAEKASPCLCVTGATDRDVGLLGPHQRRNAALAIAAVESLSAGGEISVSPHHISQGLAHVEWEGRLQILSKDPLLVIDGAHNPSAMRALVDSLECLWAGRQWTVILGVCWDKDVSGIVGILGSRVDRFILTPLADERSWNPQAFVGFAKGFGCKVAAAEGLESALAMARADLPSKGAILITGSFFLVGQALRLTDGKRGRESFFSP